MKPISNTSRLAAELAERYVASVLPRSGYTHDTSGGDVYLYAALGGCGPCVSATWEGGRYVQGRVGERSFTTVQGFLNALRRAVTSVQQRAA